MKVAGVELSGATVLVAGMAKSGLAAMELLGAQGARVIATDERPLEQLKEAAASLRSEGVPFRRQGPETAKGAHLVVVSPGVPLDIEMLRRAASAGVPVIGELELAGYFLQGPVIGITGSNGKTTTTSLVGHILSESGIPAQVGGNIGTPPAAMVSGSRRNQWNVLELSSFQLETVEHFRAEIAVGLNLTPDHLDRHRTFEAYAAAKGRLFTGQAAEGHAVLNSDDATCVRYGEQTRARPLWFSLTRAVSPGLWLEGESIRFDGEVLMPAGEVPLRGRHNIENVMAAAGATRLAGASLAQIAAAVRTFPGVEHRIEFVRTLRGVSYYNDSKATNVDAALKAINAFDGRLWIILGGKDKGGDYAPLAARLREKAAAALLIGAAAPKIEAAIQDQVPVRMCGTLAAALAAAQNEASEGDVVLLAPACASFDQFENYEHRGRVFKDLVRRLS